MLVPGLVRPHSTWRRRGGRRGCTWSSWGSPQLEAAQARTLSGGQQKLLELGRALMLDPTSCSWTSRLPA